MDKTKWNAGGINIVVATYGWVFVGRTTLLPNGYWEITKASNVRRWGTSKGLGELALGGPTKETILDLCGTVRILESQVISMIECNHLAWKKYYGTDR